MQIYMVVISCDRVIAKAEQIVDTCCEVQENLQTRSSERNQVFELLKLIGSKKLSYSAAGYFIINKSTLFGLIGVITTYFIVLLQFHQ